MFLWYCHWMNATGSYWWQAITWINDDQGLHCHGLAITQRVNLLPVNKIQLQKWGIPLGNAPSASWLFTQLFIQAQIKWNIKALCQWSLWGNSPVTSEFPAQMAGNAENVSIWWWHHGKSCPDYFESCRCTLVNSYKTPETSTKGSNFVSNIFKCIFFVFWLKF